MFLAFFGFCCVASTNNSVLAFLCNLSTGRNHPVSSTKFQVIIQVAVQLGCSKCLFWYLGELRARFD